MSPRPRTASNDDILDGVMRAIGRVGPARLALTDVAKETGLAPATLIQRFGSKRELLLAALERGVADVGRRFTDARAEVASPVAALVMVAARVASDVARQGNSPAAVANLLVFLLGDLDDPGVHRLATERSRAVMAGYRTLIGEAVTAGELGGADAGALARTVSAVATGSLGEWAVHREGTAARWVQEDIEAVLAPYRPRGPGHGPGGQQPAGPRARHRL